MENTPVGINRSLDMAEKKKINEFKGIRIETIQKGNTGEKKRKSISEQSDNFRWLNIWVIGIPPGWRDRKIHFFNGLKFYQFEGN